MNFLPKPRDIPTDEQLLLQTVYGLCGELTNPKENQSHVFISSGGIPLPYVRRLIDLLVERFQLPLSPGEIDDWVEYHRNEDGR